MVTGPSDVRIRISMSSPQLRGLTGDVTEPGQDRPRRGEQPVLTGGGGELGEPGAEHEAALHVAGHQAVVLERDREAVRGGSGEAGAGHQTGEGGRSRLEGREHQRGLVENADAASVVHIPILPSQIMGRKR